MIEDVFTLRRIIVGAAFGIWLAYLIARFVAGRVRFWRSPPVRTVREFRRRERIPRHS